MTFFNQRGGAKIGWLSMTWPFAAIEVSPGSIRLSAFQSFEFAPDDVVSVEEVGSIPLLYYGVRIHHNKPDYPERINFFPVGSRSALMEAIGTAGFRIGTAPGRKSRGFPMKILPLVAFLAAWNALSFLDMNRDSPEVEGPGVYAVAALWLAFALTALLPRSALLQKIFMRDGRNVGEILPMLKFTAWLSGGMALVMSVVVIVGAYD